MVILALLGLVAIAVGWWKLLVESFWLYNGRVVQRGGARCVTLLRGLPGLLLMLTGAALLGFAIGVLSAS